MNATRFPRFPGTYFSTWLAAVSLLVSFAGLFTADPTKAQDGALSFGAALRVSETYGKLPLSFEPNQGQMSPQVKFLSRGRGYALFLTGDEAVLALRSASQESKFESRTEVAQHSLFNAAALPGFFEPPEIRNSKSETRHLSLVTPQLRCGSSSSARTPTPKSPA
jgi:hypothetical protein